MTYEGEREACQRDHGLTRALADDLDQLCGQFPAWRFGTVWATAANGPDRRRVWARKDDVFLSDWNAAGLRAAIGAEQRRNGDAP